MFSGGESVLRRSGETVMEDVDYLRTRIREESEAAKRPLRIVSAFDI